MDLRAIVRLVLVLLAAGCGNTPSGFGGNDRDSGDATAPPSDAGKPFGDVIAPEAAGPCKGLQCQVVQCSGNAHTTISGTVYDPAGQNPLYDILVYVPTFPNDPLPTIAHGTTCDTCAAKIDNAMATALTDANGHFTIIDAPVGANIPLVVQVGKWRRAYAIATTACVDNPYPTSSTPADRLRLPAKQSEGDMPLIALATGCDPMDALLKKVGIDASEFTAENGMGMVHVFQGKSSEGVTTFDPPGSTSAYAFWDDLADMQKHDIIINACECEPYPRDNGYANLDAYLNGGGRFFGSHYHINFFTGNTTTGTDAVPLDAKTAAKWTPSFATTCSNGPFAFDTTFPKGKAMADWIHGVFPNIAYGSFAPTSCITADISGTVSGISQQWIYESSSKDPAYVSINTPTSAPPANRCGRAVVTDIHVGTTSTTLQQQEAALEFMLFDLAACVEDDSTTPQPPQPN